MGGLMSITGQPGGKPTRVGTSIGDITAGLFTAIGIQAALVERQRSATGQRVDVSLLDAQVAILENAIARHSVTGEIPGPIGARHPSIAPFDAFATRDGFVVIAAGNDALFAKPCEAIGAPEWLADERFRTNERRNRNQDALKGLIETTLAKRTTSEWLEVLQRAELPCGPLNDIARLIEDPRHMKIRQRAPPRPRSTETGSRSSPNSIYRRTRRNRSTGDRATGQSSTARPRPRLEGGREVARSAFSIQPPATAPRLLCERCFQSRQEAAARPLGRAEAREVGGVNLTVDQVEIPAREPLDERHERHLRRI
jgi:crotonobetainyl-CoA:carnitine CoA-transferase CaiB-like acyl-CoA transferase